MKTLFTALLLTSLALAADPPPQKEGLWTVHRQSADTTGKAKSDVTETVCRSHEYDKYAQDKAKSTPGCKMLNSTFANDTFTVEMQCAVGNSVVNSKAVTTYQGDTSSHSETRAVYTPPLMGMTEVILKMDQKYTGPCPATAKPGDVTHANGKTTNAWPH